MNRIVDIDELRVEDIPIAGGKAANLGELTSSGFKVPGGFVLTTVAYDHFMAKSGLMDLIKEELDKVDYESPDSLQSASVAIRDAFERVEMPQDLKDEIVNRHKVMIKGKNHGVAVRSSATAEDLPDASFAGQQDTFLNVFKSADLLDKVRKCWSSLFTARAISYRQHQGFDHEDVKLAVVMQKMVNSEIAGIMFTVDPNSSKPTVIIEAGYGLGESLVGGEVTPDTYIVDKFHRKIISKRIAKQTWKYGRGDKGQTIKIDVPEELWGLQKLKDDNILDLSQIGNQIEIHYEHPMDIEWCVENGEMFIVQARPITTLGNGESEDGKVEILSGEVITKGLAASPGMVTGKVRMLRDGDSLNMVKEGDIMVTTMTHPDMVPAMSRAGAIVTDEGGMTCHAAIVSRELGTPCVVGTGDATSLLEEGMLVTVNGTTGIVYEGEVESKTKDLPPLAMTQSAPVTGTKIMVNIGIPQKAEEVARLPVDGVGLLRSEFLFTSFVKEHPCKLIEEGRHEELVNKLSEAIAMVGQAFYPRPVVLRTSDFKTNEYRDMEGGEAYEPVEANPMIGWRGCSRYVSDNYREAYMMELKAIRKARDEQGLKNIWVMLPFVRTIEELKEIQAMMDRVGLHRGPDFKLYLMAEVPVNIFMADEFCEYCDGFSIGSNDLTQLIMGADRDSDILGRMGYFDERNPAIKRAIAQLIRTAHEHGKVVSICGQAPSVYPEFTEFLVREGIDSISLNPDAVIATKANVASIEQRVMLEALRELRK